MKFYLIQMPVRITILNLTDMLAPMDPLIDIGMTVSRHGAPSVCLRVPKIDKATDVLLLKLLQVALGDTERNELFRNCRLWLANGRLLLANGRMWSTIVD